jgi:hypothetical protein
VRLAAVLVAMALSAVSLVAHAQESSADGAIQLPYQLKDKHMGVATCASSVCHGRVQSDGGSRVPLNEYITWSREDPHAKAYSVLLTQRSRQIAAKLGLQDAHTAKICLDCHADNVPESRRGKEFNIADGVGCEACHGGAERWLETHSKRSSYQENVARGMFPSADLAPRTALCLSCHVGNTDKFTTHRLMGAGHPRLSFELDTFQALQPAHYQVDSDYMERKPWQSRTSAWAYGQVEAARAQAQLIQQYFARPNTVFPELALFNCHACHESSMRRLEWMRGMTTIGNPPGSVPLNDGHLRMAIVIARQLDSVAARDILSLAQMLQEASGTSRERTVQLSGRLESSLRQLSAQLATHRWTAAEQGNLVAGLLDMGARREYRDYIGAEQAMMAIELMLIELGQAERQRKRLDELYRLVEDDEAYRSDPFVRAIEQLRVGLGLSPPSASAGPRGSSGGGGSR